MTSISRKHFLWCVVAALSVDLDPRIDVPFCRFCVACDEALWFVAHLNPDVHVVNRHARVAEHRPGQVVTANHDLHGSPPLLLEAFDDLLAANRGVLR